MTAPIVKTSYLIVNPSVGTFYVEATDGTTAIGASNQPKYNGGSVIHIGTTRDADAVSPFDNVAAARQPAAVPIYGAQVIRGSASGNGVSAELPKTGGNFATMTEGEYIIRRVTDKIAGVSDTTLRSGASDYGIRRSIHFRTTVHTSTVATDIRANEWHQFSGLWV